MTMIEPEPTEIQTDPDSGVLYIRCRGLTLAWAEEAEQLKAAVKFLRAGLNSPRDKGTLVLPPGLSIKLSVKESCALAHDGIIVHVASYTNDPRRALTQLAHAFIRDRKAALENLGAFMNAVGGIRSEH